MRKFKVIDIKQHIPNYIYCNKCAKKEIGDLSGIEHIEVTFGYFSGEYDNHTYSFDLCAPCLVRFINRFKIKLKKDSFLLRFE